MPLGDSTSELLSPDPFLCYLYHVFIFSMEPYYTHHFTKCYFKIMFDKYRMQKKKKRLFITHSQAGRRIKWTPSAALPIFRGRRRPVPLKLYWPLVHPPHPRPHYSKRVYHSLASLFLYYHICIYSSTPFSLILHVMNFKSIPTVCILLRL